MALVSLSLGILNLLPIPILDGGHILMLAIEGAAAARSEPEDQGARRDRGHGLPVGGVFDRHVQ